MSDASKGSETETKAAKAGLNRPLFAILLVLVSAGLIGLDQWTKVLAERFLAGRGTIRVLGDFAVLVFAQNTGAFLSLGAGLPEALRVIALIILPSLLLLAATLYLCLWYKPSPKSLAIACLLAAGGFGNIIDRVFKGQVTDFLNFGIGRLRTGVMNVADLYILALVIMLAIGMFFEGKREKAEAKRG